MSVSGWCGLVALGNQEIVRKMEMTPYAHFHSVEIFKNDVKIFYESLRIHIPSYRSCIYFFLISKKKWDSAKMAAWLWLLPPVLSTLIHQLRAPKGYGALGPGRGQMQVWTLALWILAESSECSGSWERSTVQKEKLREFPCPSEPKKKNAHPSERAWEHRRRKRRIRQIQFFNY